jgi:dihydroorotate dehydrogenase
MYRFLIRPVLFLFDPEAVHHFTFRFLKLVLAVPGVKSLVSALYRQQSPTLKQKLFGLEFENPVGLAAGFDKDAKLIDELAALGFGFIEIGTLTPKSQPGNDKPRLFRLPADEAIINRMGFNNEGVEAAVTRLRNRKSKVIVGGNIGKNKITPNEDAFSDYAQCLKTLDPYVDYFVVNVSSPNTPGLRELQEKEPLQKLMSDVKALSLQQSKPKPVLLKIAPDLTNEQLNDIIDILKSTKADGVIATNTTISRANLKASNSELEKIGNGGLSGKPLTARSNEVIKYLRAGLGQEFPIIGVGGIMTGQDALEKIEAGANLVQLYTGFIYSGPSLIKEINRSIARSIRNRK